MTNKRILTLITLLLFLFLLVGCNWFTPNQPPVITTTTLPEATVETEYSATVEATDADGDVLTFSLVSGPTDMEISGAGVISGWIPATAGTVFFTVAVTDGKDSVSADFTITVKAVEPEPEIVLTGIEVEPETMTLFVGEKDFFKVIANYSDTTTKNVTYDCVYVSNDPNIAKVSLFGPSDNQKSVEAVGGGTAKITVTYEGEKDTIVVTVKAVEPEPEIELTGIEVDPNEVTLDARFALTGLVQQLEVTAYYDDGDHRDITSDCTYVSNDPSIASVNDNGRILAKGLGTTTITVTYLTDWVVVVPVTVIGELIVTQNSGQNDINRGENKPYINWTIDGMCVEFEFVNPTPYYFAFDYRVDGEAGEMNECSNIPITGGELLGEYIGLSYNIVNLDNRVPTGGPDPEPMIATVRVCAEEEVWVGLRLGAEHDWYLDWIIFEGRL